MISVNNLSLYFGGQDIFKDISFMINKGDKIGLVGKNGVGKSTLLKILSSNQSASHGFVSFSGKIVVGYLMQDLDFEDGRTVVDEAKEAFVNLNRIEKDLNSVNKQLLERDDYETKEYLNLITNFNELEERFRMSGGHTIDSDINQVLTGLGFKIEDFERQTTEFSGGWRMRIELAKLLLKKPDILLLDEPTNHLDIESIIWLEKWLKNYEGVIVLVSHDKIFLDSLTNRTIEIAFGKIADYKVSYIKYLDLRKDRIDKQIQAKKNQDKFIKETKELINKFRAKKNKAAFAQTLIKKLDKLDIIEVEQEDISRMRFSFSSAPRSGKVTLRICNASKTYGKLRILSEINLEIVRGEKIAFVGKNGEGKTTLAKMIVNKVDFIGEITLGHQVKVGYYAQNQSDFLDGEKTVLETIEDAANNENSSKVRSILGSFLFSNEDVDKKVKILSGGERARVSLCKLLLEPYNLLIMDEPTNHLDIVSKQLLKEALQLYDGSLIVVSHDRDFLQELTNKVYEFKNQSIKEYTGDVDAFLLQKDLHNFKQLESFQNRQNNMTESNKNKKTNYEFKERKKKEDKKLRNRVSKIEKEIDELQLFKNSMDNKLLDPVIFSQLSTDDQIFINYKINEEKIADLTKEWERLIDQLGN